MVAMSRLRMILIGLVLISVGVGGYFTTQHSANHPPSVISTTPAQVGSTSSQHATVDKSKAPEQKTEVNSNGETYAVLPPAAHPEGVEKVNDAD